MKRYCLLLIFSFACLLLFSVQNLTVNGETAATVTLGDQIELYFEFENIGNSATISFMIDIPLIDTSSLDFIQGTLVDGGILDSTPEDGVFQASIPAFWQPPSGLPLQITVVDEGVSETVTVTFVPLVSSFSISGSVKKETDYGFNLPVFPAVVNVLYNTDIFSLEDFDFDLSLDSLLTFFENRYLVTEINGLLGNYTATIPDTMNDVSCVIMPLSLLDFQGTHNAPETRIEVINGATPGINFLYTLPDCIFSGTVANVAGEPISYAAINLYCAEESNNAFGMSDEEGNFSILLDNGTYSLNVLALGYALYSDEVVVNNQDITLDVVLQPLIDPSGTLSGTITNSAGEPIPNAEIDLFCPETTATAFLVSDAEGSFSIDLNNGVYELTVSAPDYHSYTSEVVIDYLNVNLDIILEPIIAPGAILSGTIVDNEGDTYLGVTITIVNIEDESVLTLENDENGYFSTYLDNADYIVEATIPGHSLHYEELTIYGEDIHLDIVVEHISNEDNNIEPALNLEVSAYPNPFNSSLSIEINTAKNQPIIAKIYNLKGQLINTINLSQTGLNQTVIWNGVNSKNEKVANGIYLLRVTSGEHKVSRKVILMK